MTKPTFKKGDVVQLKSGGPKMTVTSYERNMHGDMMVWCQWFNNVKPPYKLEHGTFEPEALKNLE